jgi:hypothetical protein
MNRFVLVVMSLLTLVLSACGTSELPEYSPVEDEALLDINLLEISDIKLELPGCTLPALQPDSIEASIIEQGGYIYWGCIRYAAQ